MPDDKDPDEIDTQPSKRWPPSLPPLRRHAVAPGEYPWDRWQRRALAAGLAVELAELGRAVMREADQHVWSAELQAECGWADEGAAMLAHALADPRAARARWQALMDADGAPVRGPGE